MRVAEYLAAPRPAWDWVHLDCCRWVARWVELCGRQNPITALGLDYATERQAIALIVRRGGLVQLWTDGMALVGAPETAGLTPGCVGIIQRPTICGLNEAAAIYTGERWAALGLRGQEFMPAPVLKAWRP
ncbi:DUF6950 family protein [Sphingomonas sp. Leaf10]|uniref:DUF6950 family protein n=1 Tax=Sphingomonas sp. Leaf10 TaxID=1735676 RepID=UPI0006FD9054|nr:hypothetical protein [Sphingomonas sp. Leaf10]KQM37929.1 hypothetical protein ASE59_11555 [Sphingomonas sp. Leaf10]